MLTGRFSSRAARGTGPPEPRWQRPRPRSPSLHDRTEQFDQGLVGFPGLRREAGNEADAEFFEHRKHVLFRSPEPQRVFALESRHALHGVRAADGLQPSPSAETSRPLFPSLRIFIMIPPSLQSRPNHVGLRASCLSGHPLVPNFPFEALPNPNIWARVGRC